MQSARLCNALGDIKPDGGKKGSDTERKRETEKEKGEAIYMFSRWTQRKKEDYSGQKNQPSKKWNDKYSFLKGEKYQSKPISQKREERKDTSRLKDTTSDLSVHTLKTKCLMERCGEGSLSYEGKPRQEYCWWQFCLLQKWMICIYFECRVPL